MPNNEQIARYVKEQAALDNGGGSTSHQRDLMSRDVNEIVEPESCSDNC